MYNGCSGAVGVGIRLPFNGKREIELPNGLCIKYPEMQAEQGQYGPEFTYQKTRFRNKIYGGAVTENITQALARIVVAYQMCAIKKKLDERSARLADGKIRRVVHMVHDEVVVVVPDEEAQETKTMMEKIMSKSPSWAQGLPLACEAGLGKNYGEAK
jgi:DNA polymerase